MGTTSIKSEGSKTGLSEKLNCKALAVESSADAMGLSAAGMTLWCSSFLGLDTPFLVNPSLDAGCPGKQGTLAKADGDSQAEGLG